MRAPLPSGPGTDSINSKIWNAAKLLREKHLSGQCPLTVSATDYLHGKLLKADVDELVMTLVGQGVPPTSLIDIVIPETARILGENWLSDNTSFADVTIGASRLQQIVRNLEASLNRSHACDIHDRPILLILPKSEQHSLGMTVIASQFRRVGIRVELIFEDELGGLFPKIEKNAYLMIGLSLGSVRSIERAGALIKKLKNTGMSIPVTLGGPALQENPDSIISSTGADFFARSAIEALDFCGTRMPHNKIIQ